MPKPVIITCAPTGGIHTPTMSDALPYTYDAIATQAVEAAEVALLKDDPRFGGLKDYDGNDVLRVDIGWLL